MTSAFGKVILLGEHAVVYGYPALAGAIDCPLRAHFSPAPPGIPIDSADLRLRVPSWQLDVTRASDHIVAAALDALVRAVDEHADASTDSVGPLLGCIDIDTELPAAAGLGSSAALSVALARLLWHVLLPDRPAPTDSQVEAIAERAERCFHNNPSGVDVALATRGGVGVFVRGQGLRPLAAPALPLAVGLSGQARRTADLVARVARARSEDSEGTDRLLAILGQAAEAGQDALVRGDLDALGALANRAHDTLAQLGLSTDILDRLVGDARAHGAPGAKLTGAGGGGAVIALARDRQHAERICQGWRALGHKSFACTLGARP